MPKTLAPPIPLRTERLALRPFTEADIDALYAMRSDPDHVRYLPFGAATADDIAATIAKRKPLVSLGDEGSAVVLAMELAATGEMIGEVLLFDYSAHHRSALHGYALATAYHGKGYVTEAARALLGWGFGTGLLHRVAARCDTRNLASVRVLERLGFTREGHTREDFCKDGAWSDSYIFGLLESEWRG